LKGWQEEIADAELLSDNYTKCDGPCERENVITTKWLCRGNYVDRKVTPEYNYCYWCAAEFNEQWDELWSMYYSQCL